jgi:hypothetical protein
MERDSRRRLAALSEPRMMYHPAMPEIVAAMEASRCRRSRLRRLFFDALGVVCIVAVITGDWWMH